MKKYNLSEIMRNAWKFIRSGMSKSAALKNAWAIAKGNRTITVKAWVIDKAQQTATHYNCFIDYERNDEGMAKIENGCMTVFVDEYIAETEKAVQVRLHTGNVVGSYKGWKLWIPKSQIAA